MRKTRIAKKRSTAKVKPGSAARKRPTPKMKVKARPGAAKSRAKPSKKAVISRQIRAARNGASPMAQRLESRPIIAELPSYEQLPIREGAPAGAAWGVFGDTDQVGTINLLTPERVKQATGFVRSGRVFSLNLP